jgi:NADH-quinone oxidoreductase subunit A
MFSRLLAQNVPVFADPRSAWTPVVVLLVIAIGFAIVNVIASVIIGPSREGDAKSTTYESGMTPVGDTRRRFNVRFYVVAMIFLVIDVEIIFFYPWATIFSPFTGSTNPAHAGFGGVLLVEILIFVALLLLAYIYAWGKGVFRWD